MSFTADGRRPPVIFPSTDLLTFVMNQVTQLQITLFISVINDALDLVSRMMVHLTTWHLTSWQLERISLPIRLRIFQCQYLPKNICYFLNSLDYVTINHSMLSLQLKFLEIVNQPDFSLLLHNSISQVLITSEYHWFCLPKMV